MATRQCFYIYTVVVFHILTLSLGDEEEHWVQYKVQYILYCIYCIVFYGRGKDASNCDDVQCKNAVDGCSTLIALLSISSCAPVASAVIENLALARSVPTTQWWTQGGYWVSWHSPLPSTR
jgi:intracellular septation protein A